MITSNLTWHRWEQCFHRICSHWKHVKFDVAIAPIGKRLFSQTLSWLYLCESSPFSLLTLILIPYLQFWLAKNVIRSRVLLWTMMLLELVAVCGSQYRTRNFTFNSYHTVEPADQLEHQSSCRNHISAFITGSLLSNFVNNKTIEFIRVFPKFDRSGNHIFFRDQWRI